MPSQQRSGLSATVGLVMVVALLLVAGTLAVSGGGILSGGGRLGVDPIESAEAPAGVDVAQASVDPAIPLPSSEAGGETAVTGKLSNSFDYTCAPDTGAIRDPNKGRWNVSRFLAGHRDDFDRITWELTKPSKAKRVTTVQMEWMDIKDAREQFGLERLPGQRAIVITFDGPVSTNANQSMDALFLEPEDIEAFRSIQLFTDDDGKVRTVIGVHGDGCGKMSAPLWKKKSNTKRAKIFLDVELP